MNERQHVLLRRWASLLFLLLGLYLPASGTPYTCVASGGGYCDVIEEKGDYRLHIEAWAVPLPAIDSAAEVTYGLTIYTAGPIRHGILDWDLWAHGGGSAGGGSSSVVVEGELPEGEWLSLFAENRFHIHPSGEDAVLLGTPLSVGGGAAADCRDLDFCSYPYWYCPDGVCIKGPAGVAVTLQFFEAVPDPAFPDCPDCFVPGDPVRILYAPPVAIPEPSALVLTASGLVLGLLRRLAAR